MTLAAISLCALVAALIVSCFSTLNVGFLAIVLAWIVGTFIGGMRVDQVLGGFPTSLFLTLAGITLLFAQAQGNGTLDRLAHRAVRGAGRSPGVIPIIFFALTAALSSIGPGNIAATALMAPLGMAAAGRYGIPPFLMAIMIANGASAGSVSPVTPTGVIVAGITTKIGLEDVRWAVYVNNLIAHAAIALIGYLLFGGWRLLRERRQPIGAPAAVAATITTSAVDTRVSLPMAGDDAHSSPDDDLHFAWQHWLTCVVIAALVVGVVGFNVNVGLGAFAGAVILTIARAADEHAAVRAMPWPVIMMVCGVSTLVALLERTGGIDLFAAFLARMSTPATATAVVAFFTGVISIYSSTTGVVLPALLPTIPALIARIGGGDAMDLVSSMIVGGHLVDVSPLSTLGALCLAAAPRGTDTRAMFNQLLAWGVSMSVVAAVVCWLVFR